MGRSFNFPKFRAGEPLLPQLTAERLNALVDAMDRNRVEFGDNITGQRTPGGVIIRTNPRADGNGGDLDHPFKVVKTVDDTVPPYPVLKVLPGVIGNIIPTLATARLDKRNDEAGVKPWFYSPTGDYSLLLKVMVDTGTIEPNKRAGIISVSVISSLDPSIPDDIKSGTPPTVMELYMRWDNAGTPEQSNSKGYFFIKIADIHAITVAEGPTAGSIEVRNISQFLTQSYLTFVITSYEVIPMV
jgi:hypothetical protein